MQNSVQQFLWKYANFCVKFRSVASKRGWHHQTSFLQ